MRLLNRENFCFKTFPKISSSPNLEVISESENSEGFDFELEMDEEFMCEVTKYSSEYLSSSEEEYAYRNHLIAEVEWAAR